MAVQISNYDLSIKERDSNLKKNVDSAFFEFMNRQYGLEKLALKHIEGYLIAFNKFQGSDSRIDIMRKFLGLDTDKLPYSIFETYLRLIKASNINHMNLFNTDLVAFHLDFYKTKQIFKEIFP